LPIVVSPILSVGFSGEHMDFAGTLSLSPNTLMLTAKEMVLSLIHHGFERFLFLNGHSGNEEALRLTARMLRQEHNVLIAATSYWQLAREEIKAIRESPGGGMNHAGEEETSLMLFLRPDLVNMDLAEPNPLHWRTSYLSGSYVQEAPVTYGRRRVDIAPLGHNGDPTRASAEKGKRLFEAIVAAVATFLADFDTWRLDGMAVSSKTP
jgi:creatinine amidohydrolase